MGFVAGQSGNPDGRPKGSRNKRTKEIFDRLDARGDRDPLDVLSDILTNNPSTELKVQAANILAPYKHSKMQAIPAPRFVDDVINVPNFDTVEQAQDFLKEIAIRAGRGELELQSASDISGLVRNWIISKYDAQELDLKLANSAATIGDQTIRIEGGLPPLPGTNITMPLINGHTIDGSVLMPPDTPAVPAPEDQAQGPSPTNSFPPPSDPQASDPAPPTADSGPDPS